MKKLVIAIDGPAGAGKSTVAKKLASELSLRFLDTGAMYRALALKCHRLGILEHEGERAAEVASSTIVWLSATIPQQVTLDGEDVTEAIREVGIGNLASALSVHSAVRKVLARQQRTIVESGGVVLEGRDTTTVTAFDAPVRVFLTASLAERAKRRHAELLAKGQDVDFDTLKAQIEERDARDSSRADSPLVIAPRVTVLDTDGMTIDQVVDRIKQIALAAMRG